MFEKIEKFTHSERIIDRIKELLLSRELSSGDRLPSEREMAEQFGVSRASIREAVSALTAMGMLESRTGDGTYVRSNMSEAILAPLSWAILFVEENARDLIEARQAIEPYIASLAAQRATEEDKERLKETIVRMRKAIGDPTAVANADLNFHLRLAEAAHNRLLFEIMVGLQHLLQRLIASHKYDIGTHESTLQEHIAILDAIEAADPEESEKAMLINIRRPFVIPTRGSQD